MGEVRGLTDEEVLLKRRQPDNDIATYAQMGIAAMLPGMVHAVEILQAQIDAFKARLAGLQNGHAPEQSRRSVANGQNSQKYWSKLTPQQRKAEMRRRFLKGQRKKDQKAKATITRAEWKAEKPTVKMAKPKQPNHPANQNHPGHAAWLAKVQAARAQKAAAA
jgi:hypothetical protein